RAGPGPARARHPGRPGRCLVRLPARAAGEGLADRGLRARPRRHRRRVDRGRPLRGHPRDGAGPMSGSMTTALLRAVPADNTVSPGVLGFVVVALLGVATWLLL